MCRQIIFDQMFTVKIILYISRFLNLNMNSCMFGRCPETLNQNSGHFLTRTLLPVLSDYLILLLAS